MFQFDCYCYEISRSGVSSSLISANELNPKLFLLLQNFEERVFERLNLLSDFKYIQGSIGGASIFNQCKNQAGLNNEDVFLISNHPNYIGTDLIHKYFQTFSEKETYCVFFAGFWQKQWLNSQVNKEHLLETLEQMLKVTGTNKVIRFYTIELYASDEFSIKQINLGSSRPRWKAQRKI